MQAKARVPILLGMDAGGSKTDVLICTAAGEILAKAKSGCGNHQKGREAAEKNINEAVEKALKQANLQKEDIDFAFFGLAGADRQWDYAILNPMIAKIGFSAWQIACDTRIAFRAGSRFPYGVVLICGTGENCGAYAKDGKELQIGGFGELYGDYGAGKRLAYEAFRYVIRAWDGREAPTAMTQKFLDHLGFPNVDAMWNDFLDREVQSVSADFAALLIEAAKEGDIAAQNLLLEQAEALAHTANTAILKMNLQEEVFDVVLAGSIGVHSPDAYLYDVLQNKIKSKAPNANLVKLKHPPVIGAILCAADALQLPVSESLNESLYSYQPKKDR